jgi:hypothetical protein
MSSAVQLHSPPLRTDMLHGDVKALGLFIPASNVLTSTADLDQG